MNVRASDISGMNRRTCITVLHKNLAELGIAVLPNDDKSVLGKPRGGAYFMEYTPEGTSFRIAPDFPRLFYATQRYGLISPAGANSLVHKLLMLGARVRNAYRGALAKQLETGLIGEFLDYAQDPEALRLIETRGVWFPDVLIEQFNWPCVVEDYLLAREFSTLRLNIDTISKNADVPIRSLAGAMDLVRTGPWLGLATDEIDRSLDLLGGFAMAGQPLDRSYAEKLVIPIFSSGYQGSIIGFFCNLDRDHKRHIRAILDQAGHCLGEICALERQAKVRNLLNTRPANARKIAEAILQIASPVERIAVSYAGDHYAFAVLREENYLAGYEAKCDQEAAPLHSAGDRGAFEVDLHGQPATISIAPLQHCAAFDPTLHVLRVKTALSELLKEASSCVTTQPSKDHNGILPIQREELDRIISTLTHQMAAPHGRRVTAKRLSFFEIVKSEFGSEEVRLSNGEMLRRMSDKLAEKKISGYQVTGEALRKFESDINDLCPEKFLFQILNDRVIRVQWLSGR